MPPRRRGRGSLAGPSTSKTPTPLRDVDSVDVDTPQASDTPAVSTKPALPTAEQVMSNLWTDDQESSLFKAIIRWKPTGTARRRPR